MTTLVLERILSAPANRVFDFVTQQQNLLKWWGPEGMNVPEGDLDLSQPGPWYSVMVNADGKRFKVSGEVTKVTPPNVVTFTWGWHDENDDRGHESEVEFEVVPVSDSQTRLIIRHSDLADAESSANHDMGWTSSLKKLERLLS